MESSLGEISIAFVVGFCFGLSQLRIDKLGCAARRMVANFLKYMEIPFVLFCCEFVGNSTVSFISQTASKSPALTKNVSETVTPLPCNTGATRGRGVSHDLLLVGDHIEAGKVKVGENL